MFEWKQGLKYALDPNGLFNQFVGNKAKGRISKQVFQERNVRFSKIWCALFS